MVIFTVELIRGPLPTKVWEHESIAAARRRADALVDLHSCDTYTETVLKFTVDATEYYTPREKS